MLYKKFFLLSLSALSISGYIREVANYGNVPVKVTFHHLGGPVCPDDSIVVGPKKSATRDGKGCCLKSITLSHYDAIPKIPARDFPVDDYTLLIPWYDMRQTGAGAACKNTSFVFWNTSKEFQSPMTEILKGGALVKWVSINGRPARVFGSANMNFVTFADALKETIVSK